MPQNDTVSGFEKFTGKSGAVDLTSDPIADFEKFRAQAPKTTAPAESAATAIAPPPQSASDYLKGAAAGIGRGLNSLADPVRAAYESASHRGDLGDVLDSVVSGMSAGEQDAQQRLRDSQAYLQSHPTDLKAHAAYGRDLLLAFPVIGPQVRSFINTYQNDPWAAVGQAAGVAALGKVTGKIATAGEGNAVEAARGPYERAVLPNTASVSEREYVNDIFNRSAKYIAPQAKDKFGFWDYWGHNTTGLQRGISAVETAKDKLWQTAVQPAIDEFGSRSMPVDSVANDVMNSFTDVDRNSAAGQRAIRAGQQWSQRFQSPMTIKDMSEWVRQLNNEKAVSRFYNMSPEEQTSAMLADPALRAKVVTLRSLRNRLFGAVEEVGGPELGKQFRESRLDWGALSTMQTILRDEVKAPTAEPMTVRVANSVRSMLNPKAAALDTIGGSKNPHNLISQSFGKLGKSGLEPSVLPPRPVMPGATPPPPGQMPLTGMPGPLGEDVGAAAPAPYAPPPVHAPWEAAPTPTGGVQMPMTPIPTDMVPAQPQPQGALFATGQTPQPAPAAPPGMPSPSPFVLGEEGAAPPARSAQPGGNVYMRSLDEAPKGTGTMPGGPPLTPERHAEAEAYMGGMKLTDEQAKIVLAKKRNAALAGQPAGKDPILEMREGKKNSGLPKPPTDVTF